MAEEEPEDTEEEPEERTPAPRRERPPRLTPEQREQAIERARRLMPDAEPVPEEELNDLFFNLR